jgi:hypothetical protein
MDAEHDRQSFFLRSHFDDSGTAVCNPSYQLALAGSLELGIKASIAPVFS